MSARKPTLEGRRVLVTGGAGVIGRELIERLTAQGARVLCCDLEPRPAEFGPNVEHVRGDANHLSSEAVAGFRPELCFHLAATFERSVESAGFWGENFWHNVRLSHHLMTLLRDAPDLRRVVFASSYLIYDPALYSFDTPPAQPVRLRESSPIRPRNICGAAKLLHEIELRFLTDFPDARFSSVSARIFRVYGRGSRDVVSRWVRALVQDPEATLEVFRPEGIFDYVYAGDVAEGLLRLAQSPATGVVNLGSGHGRRVSELVDVLRDRFPRLRSREIDADIAWEGHQADVWRLQECTGWRPATSLEDGVKRLINHERAAVRSETDSQPSGAFGVLVTSASRKVDLIQRHRRALHDLGIEGRVFAADLDGDCVAREFADGFWEMRPLGALPVEDVIDFCKEHGVRLLVPTRDGELAWFAEHHKALAAAGISLPLAAAEDVRDCLDKLRFYERCREAGIPAIPTGLELDAVAQETGAGAQETGAARFVVKERYGAGGRSIGLGLDREQALAHAAQLRAPVFQPRIEGTEHSIDLYVNRDGALVDAVPRLRARVHGGESVVSETVESPILVEGAAAVARAFGLRGHAVLQAFTSGDQVTFIECNPRYGGASALAFEAGLDSPRWAVLEALGRQVAPNPGGYRRGLRLLRYAADRFVERA